MQNLLNPKITLKYVLFCAHGDPVGNLGLREVREVFFSFFLFLREREQVGKGQRETGTEDMNRALCG